MTTLTITAKGQVTLRKDLLAHMGATVGAKVVIDKLPGGRIEIRTLPQAGNVAGALGLLKSKTKVKASLEQIDAAAQAAWANRAR